MSNVFTDQRLLSAQELSRLAAAVDGTYVFPSNAGGAVTANSGLQLNVAAITGNTVTINGSVISTAYAGGTVTHDAADATNPRRDYIYYNTSGAVGIKKGTAAAKPVLPDLAATEIAVAEIYIAANDTTISGASEIIDKRQANPAPTVVQKYKTATQTFTTTTTFADVTASSGNFAFSIAANEVWKVQYRINLAFGGTGGVKFQLTGPSAPTAVTIMLNQSAIWLSDAAIASNVVSRAISANAAAFSATFGGANSGTGGTNNEYDSGSGVIKNWIDIDAVVANGSNAGTVTLQAAQNSSNSTTTLGIGSYMIAQRMA